MSAGHGGAQRSSTSRSRAAEEVRSAGFIGSGLAYGNRSHGSPGPTALVNMAGCGSIKNWWAAAAAALRVRVIVVIGGRRIVLGEDGRCRHATAAGDGECARSEDELLRVLCRIVDLGCSQGG